MCLITNMPCAKISDHDIICFKIVILDEDNNLITPYQRTKVVKHMKASGEIQIGVSPTGRIKVGGGFIHAFTTLPFAWINAKLHLKSGIVLKAYIPKGVKYFVGLYGEICAREIIIENQITAQYDLDSQR